MSQCTAIVPELGVRPGHNLTGSTIGKYLFVAIASAGPERVTLPAVNGGVLGATMQEIEDGVYGDVQVAGKCIVTAGGTVSRGDEVTTTAAGKAVLAAGAGTVVGVCVKGGTVDQEIEVELSGVGAMAAGSLLVLDGIMADVSAANDLYFVSPVAGVIERIDTVLGGPITVADANLTTSILAGGVGAPAAVTGGALVIANVGSAAGVTDSATPTAARTVAAGDSIKVASDGASTTTATLRVSVSIRVA